MIVAIPARVNRMNLEGESPLEQSRTLGGRLTVVEGCHKYLHCQEVNKCFQAEALHKTSQGESKLPDGQGNPSLAEVPNMMRKAPHLDFRTNRQRVRLGRNRKIWTILIEGCHSSPVEVMVRSVMM